MRYLPFELTFAALLNFCHGSSGAVAGDVSGTQRQWHTVEVTFDGPELSEDDPPNPFVDYRMTVLFIHADSTQRYEVPGFFAADGHAAETSATKGNKWRARFSPSLMGRWTYKAELKRDGAVIDLAEPEGETALRVETIQRIGGTVDRCALAVYLKD